eukprot:TRINITY_DN9750_c0_g2_i1.p1 TRINITY_DN9750_c0_g2~~TRINITY_DN9750_c0_g2_i1.p1  ORF type:complete len:221 (-),score=56.62 TRINITY_DN9750_c0_g2_i1:302-964(-)
MSDLFQTYETDFLVQKNEVVRAIDSITSETADVRRQSEKNVDARLKEMDVLIQQMELEVRSLSEPKKSTYAARLKDHKSQVSNSKANLKRNLAAAKEAESRSALMDASAYELGDISVQQRKKVTGTTDKLHQTSARIQETHRIVLETEEVGTAILAELSDQRDTLERVRGNLGNTQDKLSEAKRVITSMGKRMVTNKIMMLMIILFLLGAIVFVIYWQVK